MYSHVHFNNTGIPVINEHYVYIYICITPPVYASHSEMLLCQTPGETSHTTGRFFAGDEFPSEHVIFWEHLSWEKTFPDICHATQCSGKSGPYNTLLVSFQNWCQHIMKWPMWSLISNCLRPCNSSCGITYTSSVKFFLILVMEMNCIQQRIFTP